MADLEEDDTSSNAARQGVPALSSLESGRKASETSSLEPSSGVPSVSIEYGNPLTENTEIAQRHESYYKEMPENLEDDMEEGIDTSWDQITPKFKEARHAMYNEHLGRTNTMYNEHEAGVPELHRMPSGVRGVVPSNASTTSVPTGGEFVQSKFAQALKTQSGPASSLKSTQKQPTLQRREESRGAPKPPPLSLRKRASRFTSNILSPFRSRKESQPEDDVYPKVAYLYDPQPSEDRGGAYKSPSPSSGDKPERWPEVPGRSDSNMPAGARQVDYGTAEPEDYMSVGESFRNPDFYTSRQLQGNGKFLEAPTRQNTPDLTIPDIMPGVPNRPLERSASMEALYEPKISGRDERRRKAIPTIIHNGGRSGKRRHDT
jgi:hypothetical protein